VIAVGDLTRARAFCARIKCDPAGLRHLCGSPVTSMWRCCSEFSSLQLAVELLSNFVCSLLIVLTNVGCGIIMFGPDSPHVGAGILFCLLSSVCCPLPYALLRGRSPSVFLADAFVMSLIGLFATDIQRSHPDAAFGTVIIATIVTSQLLMLTTLVAGVVPTAARLVQFVPLPVRCGYLAASGFVMLDSAVKMTTSCRVTAIGCLFTTMPIDRWRSAISIALGTTFYASKHLAPQILPCSLGTSGARLFNALLVPVCIVVASIICACILVSDAGEQVLDGWTIRVPDSATVLSLPAAFATFQVEWQLAVVSGFKIFLASAIPVNIGKLFCVGTRASKLQIRLPYSEYPAEMIKQALAQTLSVVPAGQSLAAVVTAFEMGGRFRSHLPAIGVALANVIMLCGGLELLKLLPTFLFAALVVNTSCLFLVDEIVYAYRQFRRREFALVLLHVVIAAAYGMLEAIIAGLLLTGMIFVVEYSRPVHSGVQATSTVGQERSRVVRSAAEVEHLERASSSRTLIIHLRGDLFFGSVPHVAEVLRRWDDLTGSDAPKEDGAHTAMSATDVESKGVKSEPLAVSGDLTGSLSASEPRMVLFDCSFCTGIDSSAAASLAEAIGAMNPEVQAMFACACEDVLVPITNACRGRAKLTSHSTLDLALERCEELLLKGHAISPNSSPAAQRPRGHGFTPQDEADGRGELCTETSAEETISSRTATLDTALMSDQLVDDSSRSMFVVFTPDDSRYNTEERQRAFARLDSLCVRVHGVVGMAEFVRMMDIVLTPPFTALNFVKEQSPQEGNPAKDCHAIEPFSILRTSAPPVDAYVYVLLSGYVTEKLIQRSNSRGERQRADRVAKLRPGAVLGAASFETFLIESRQQHHSQRLWSKVSLHLSVVGVTDTFCLLARFPASRYARMESENPAMALKLMRLIARSSLDRLGDMMNEAVATDRFRTGVSPTSKHEGLERWLPAPTNTVEVGSPSFAAANDPGDTPTCDIDGRPCDARAIAGPIARTRSSPQCNRRCELPSLSVGAEAPMSAMDDVSMKHGRPRESSELQPSRSLDTLRHADSNVPSTVHLPQAVPKRLPTPSCSAQAFSTRTGARSRASRPVSHFLRLPEEGDGSSSDEDGHEFAKAAAQGGTRSFFRLANLPESNV
jgi:hypothetical protein